MADSPNGNPKPPHATVVDNCVVHGDAPTTPEGEAAMRDIIAAVRARDADGSLRSELAACRMAILRAADIAAAHATLTGNSGMRAESARFLHQAAKVKALLEGSAK